MVGTVDAISAHEPDTLLYVTSVVKGEPLTRVFYEIYADEEAFRSHEDQSHMKRFLIERERYIRQLRVEYLTPTAAIKGLVS